MIPRTLLLILDGYGLAKHSSKNAASLAKTPTLDALFGQKCLAKLEASGEAVGLPAGFIGNSEVGHLNIGGGRVVLQDMKRIDADIEDLSFFSNPALVDLCTKIRESGGRLHLMGLLSDGGVHSHINHIKALLKLSKEQKVQAVLHAFLDGRDTSPNVAFSYIEEIMPYIEENNAILGSLCGRYFAMDRDKRWERMEKAWNLLVHGRSEEICQEKGLLACCKNVIENAYAQDKSDEFVLPYLVTEQSNVQDGDGIFFFNFRADRARQLVHAFVDQEYSFFERGSVPRLAGLASMTAYAADLDIPIAYGKDVLGNTIGEVVESLNLSQLRIAETEKYAHVTYFFSGGREENFAQEDRLLVPSPKDVPTYDLKPEMSAYEVTDKLINAWENKGYDFVVCNLANPDMVGHTGNLEAAIQSCEIVDACVARIEKAVLASGGFLCVTADHGNVEEMLDEDGKMQTAHSMNCTPLVIKNSEGCVALKEHGKLGDIAPTLLALWKVEKPVEMKGENLLA